MSRQLYVFDRPQRFVAGTVGQPGERTFYLQVSDGPRTVSVSLEKTQVIVLADRMSELLDEVATRQSAVVSPEAVVSDLDPLHSPVDEEFRVAAMGLAWDADSAAVVIEAVAGGDSDEPVDEDQILSDDDDGPDALRVKITPVAARAFVDRARLVVSAGRPPCPLCSLPLDADGHVCPRQNGYRR
ncbi:MAG: DUF3090 domain-containing protein [Actinomycetota bacterium]|nr:DUF3090 domain-containing protein [Actinomycetota bacterium]